MFFDIGSLEFIALIVLAILVFGPEKLPKMIQDAAGFLRKVREFSDSAKRDIRKELGPEFEDFDLQDLNPRTFARKHLLDNDDLGLRELTSSLDMRKELSEVTDAVNGRPAAGRTSLAKEPGGKVGLGKAGDAAARPAPSLIHI
ncbi:sec-independent translocase [Streptomyces specialis]|uniref:sec-independent translocase n=1 Tax=Streptomyces specialis TaxID=498367 RepID=UPI00099E2E72|nr:sec-independent translocase [Streptomyces specialis]